MKKTFSSIILRYCLPETIIYIAVWFIVLVVPIANNYFDLISGKTDSMEWSMMPHLWLRILPFFLLFIINDRVLVPMLFFKQKLIEYVVAAILLSTVTFVVIEKVAPNRFERQRHRIEQRLRNVEADVHRTSPDGIAEHDAPPHYSFKRPPRDKVPFMVHVFRGPFFGSMLIALLMFSFNIAVRLFFKSLRFQEAMKELEHNKLQSELEYLKYQINPHFFMNTLNNIHALVDIDTEKAKQTIVELSRMMRYMLYEADNRIILLSKEIQFLKHYIELMRIRFTDRVKIDVSFPADSGKIHVPPLLFVSFVENAFKHGVSYQHDSFVSVTLQVVGDEVVFRCLNSNHKKSDDKHHGIGLSNIQKRLKLLFDGSYSLTIDETPDCFKVELTVPAC